MDISVECCVCCQVGLCDGFIYCSRGVLPNVVCLSVNETSTMRPRLTKAAQP